MWLFRFPLSRHEICKAWANAMGKEISNQQETVEFVVNISALRIILKQKMESGN